jgi:hypothetical protein
MIVNGRVHWRQRPQTRPIPHAAFTSPGFTNLEGTTFGCFEVVGYLGKVGSQRNARWLVRCMCGRFECRTGKAIRGIEADHDECIRCTDERKSMPVDDRRAA